MYNIKEAFGIRLKELRKNRKLTQEKLAEMIDLTPRQLTRIETGENFPSWETLAKLSIALEVDLKCLFDFSWSQIVTLAATGTTDKPYIKLLQKNDVIDIKSVLHTKNAEIKMPKRIMASDSESSMVLMAKRLNKPVTVEHFFDGERANIKVYYPNGKIETLISENDIIIDKISNSIIESVKNISNNTVALEFVNTAINSLSNPEAMAQLKIMIKGIEASRAIRK